MKMLIKNYNELSKNERLNTALSILEEGLKTAKPIISMASTIKKNQISIDGKTYNFLDYENVYVVAFGKAADSMTQIIHSNINVTSGYIVIPHDSKSIVKNKKFTVFQCGHPIPDKQSVMAGKTILNFIQTRQKNDFIIFLISGGGSSLLSFPYGINLNEKKQLTKILIKSGATIQEINCVRKHLSKIKGGKLVADMKCEGISLVMSDVVGDDPSTISSGCTYYDKTTFDDALYVIKKYSLTKMISRNIIKTLTLGSRGKIRETPKKLIIKNYLVATNNDCLRSMALKAKQFGLKVKLKKSLSGDVKTTARLLFALTPNQKNSCLIFGGEPTVKITGRGKGGRNQEIVLRLLQNFQKTRKKILVASMGTDGIDGNTKFAGAITENIEVKSSIIDSYLKNNNSNCFFKKFGGLIITGHTHSNLMDIGIILTN